MTFLLEFHSRWAAASVHGVTGWDGVKQLIEVLPDEWMSWVESINTDFAVADPDWDTPEEADLQGLIDAIIAQYHSARGLPDSPPIADPDDDDTDMIDVSDPISDAAFTVGLDTSPIAPDLVPASDPMLVDHENPYDIEYSPIDLDLYGQPFSLDSPPYPLSGHIHSIYSCIVASPTFCRTCCWSFQTSWCD